MSTGAALGAAMGGLWSQLFPGAPVASYAVVGAVALLGAAMQAPLAALVLVVELTGTTVNLLVPMVAATALATIAARYLDGYSIYTSRLASRPVRARPCPVLDGPR